MILACSLLLMLTSKVFAADYFFPGVDTTSNNSAFANGNCTVTGYTVDCPGNLILGNNDAFILTNTVEPTVLNIAGDFTFGNGLEVNINSPSSNMFINVGGNVNPGNNAVINANLSVDGSVNTTNNATIDGGITIGGNLNLGNNSVIAGLVTVEGDANIGNNVQINGDLGANNINVGENSEINGNVEGNNINLSNNTFINGNVNATGSVNNNGTITGYVNAPNLNNNGNVVGSTCDQNVNVGPCADTDEELSTEPGAGTFVVPDGVTSITVEAWGSGGTGGDASAGILGPIGGTSRGAAGGGGGAYARATVSVTPGEEIFYRVGDADASDADERDSWFSVSDNVADSFLRAAHGGDADENGTHGAPGGAAGDSVGQIRRTGGNGAASGEGLPGGGGGSSAAPHTPGNNATGRLGANAPQPSPESGSGGDGAATGQSRDGSSPLVQPGGGGGGAHSRCVFLGLICGSGDGGTGANGQIRLTYSTTPDQPDQITHFELDRNMSSGLTCMPMEVTVRACTNENCTNQFDEPFNATLMPSNGWSGGNQIENFSSGDSLSFLPSTAGSYSLGVSSSSPSMPPSAEPKCFINGVEQANCDLIFSDAGFQFFASATASTAIGLADLIAGENSDQLYVRPVTTDPETGVCNAVFAPGETVNVETGTVCDNPDECRAGYQIEWTDAASNTTTSLPNPENPVSGSSTRPVSWTVGSNATTSFRLHSPDVGVQTLNLTYVPEDIDGNPAPDNAITGSFQVRSRPASFGFTEIRCGGTPVSDEPNPEDLSVFCEAGETFTTTLKAMDSDGEITPNFGNESDAHNLTISSELVAPNSGHNPSLGGDTDIDNQWFANGEIPDSSPLQLQWPEVGVITLRATMPSYLGWTDNDSPVSGESDNIGRFIPYDIRYELDMPPILDPAQGSFTYQGQPFSLIDDGEVAAIIRVTAESSNGERTKNYADDFFNSPISVPSSVTKDTDGMDTQADLTLLSGSLGLEVVNTEFDEDKTYSGELVWRLENLPVPEWEFTRVAADDLDGNEYPQNKSLIWVIAPEDLEDSEVCAPDRCTEGDGIEHTMTGGNLVYGRIRLLSNQGPASRPLQIEVRAEVWNGAAFETFASENDINQTELPLNGNALIPDTFTLQAIEDFDASALEIFVWSGFGEGGLEGGEGLLILAGEDLGSGPGNDAERENLGRVRVEAVGIPDHLYFAWPHTPEGQGASPPRAIASFGTYEGRPPMLFMLQQGR